jgi:DNA-binding PadR family transcriptional regulator
MDGKSKTGYVILGLLSDRALSGYDIKKLIEQRFHYFWGESYGQIYPELKRLLGDKLIKAVAVRNADRKKGGRKRRIYSITEKGRLMLFDWLALPPEKESARIEFLLKLCFGSLIPSEGLLTNVRVFRARTKRNLAALRALEGELRAALDGAAPGAHENDPFVLMTVLFGKRVYEEYLKWCTDAESTIAGR